MTKANPSICLILSPAAGSGSAKAARSLPDSPCGSSLTIFLPPFWGLPRNLLELMRPNLPCELSAADIARLEQTYYATNPATRFGSLALQQSFSRSKLVFQAGHPPFAAFTPATEARPADAVVYSAATRDAFQFTGPPMLVSQAHFARKFAALASEKSPRLVMLHMPDLADVSLAAIPERELWPDTLKADITLLGFPPRKFFAGLNAEQTLQLFADPYHLNQNGQQYFTRLITPTLIELFETTDRP